MGDKTFNLTWNNHLANLSGLFEGLYKSGSLTDTTLACQGGMLRAHRLVLAACSPYFERVFKEHYGDQPILILKGVPVEEMECLLDFMYRGSINVAEEHLPSLIKTATDLEIRGLSGDHRNESSNIYPRIETRGQTCQVETRLHPMEYRKSQQVSFLSKPACGSSMADVKLEEIEVEDDPMIMEGNEDSFEESLPQVRDQIRHIPPPMYKRNTRFDSHQRASRNQVKEQGRRELMGNESNNDEIYDNEGVKSEPIFNSNSDPTVPAIQMNEDSMDHGRSNMDSPNTEGMDGTIFKIKMETSLETSNKTGTAVDLAKDRKKNLSKSKTQFKPFPCDLCTLAFTRASHLARHRRVHTGERPFACTLCPRMFARQDKLKQHLDSHLQWPKRKALSGYSGTSQHTASTNLIAKGKRGRPRKVSVEQSAMDEIMKFGEFSSMLNKSQPLSTRMSGRRLQEDSDSMRIMHDDNGDEIEDLRCRKTDNYDCDDQNIE